MAILHFILPLGVTYTINGNYPISRALITVYVVTPYAATAAGVGFLGGLRVDVSIKTIVGTAVLALVLAWLYRNPRMRYYYCVISDKPLPPELEARELELQARLRLKPGTRAALEWFADHLETTILLAAVVVAVYAFVSTG